MDSRLQRAQALIEAGQRAEAIDLLGALLTEAPGQPVTVYRNILLQHYRLGRHADGADWADKGLLAYPGDLEILNLKGVMLRRAKRLEEALAVFIELAKRSPNNENILANLANVHNDMLNGAAAAKIFLQLTRRFPRNAEYVRLLGVALRHQDRGDQAITKFRQALAIDKANVDAWCDLAGCLSEQGKTAEALEAIDSGIAANPGNMKALEAKVKLLRQMHQLRVAETLLESLLPAHDGEAWVHHSLGSVISDYDRERGLVHLRRAVELAPKNSDYVFALAESLDRARGPKEARHLEEAYHLIRNSVTPDRMKSGELKVANEVYARLCAFDDVESLGSFAEVGRRFVKGGKHTALLAQLARGADDADRLELLEQHRQWGAMAVAGARKAPIRRPKGPPASGKYRLGFMSSDLRRHPVAYFALPLFEHLDSERFEVFCYSFSEGASDEIQDFITSKVTAFRWAKDVSAREAAQLIADDGLDMLIELGGSTHMNKLSAMAYGAAPLQASWLGYPHSAGLETIDHLICDPFNAPPRPELLIETPLVMPRTWIALGRQIFREAMENKPDIPQDREGVLTFGTANNPYKYTRKALSTWGQVLMRVPDSRIMFVRPECASPIFRGNITRVLQAEGVTPDRIVFKAVRGGHMPYYNDIDISLDTFPLTGGTTTCEALWMGVPVVSLVGEAFFERLSYSILNNVDLGDLCADSLEGFIDIAAALAADPERRRALRPVIRQRMIEGPLGQTEAFARDFYNLIAKTVEAARVGKKTATA